MSNPTFTRTDAEKLARSRGCNDQIMLLGFRSSTSKYGEYDDTLALLTPTEYIEFKGNTLPSKWERNIAKLMPGDWKWKKGLHGIHHFDDIEKALGIAKRTEIEHWLNQHVGEDYPPISGLILPYWAFRQAGPMSVQRDGALTTETIIDPNNWPFVDGHKGGWNGTSSLACQTWFPDRWLEARTKGYAVMDQYGQVEITYGLHQL